MTAFCYYLLYVGRDGAFCKAHMWVSEEKLQKWVFSYCHRDSGFELRPSNFQSSPFIPCSILLAPTKVLNALCSSI